MLRPGESILILYMVWLPFEDKIAGASKKLVLKFNPSWGGAGETIHQIAIPDGYKKLWICSQNPLYPCKLEWQNESLPWKRRITYRERNFWYFTLRCYRRAHKAFHPVGFVCAKPPIQMIEFGTRWRDKRTVNENGTPICDVSKWQILQSAPLTARHIHPQKVHNASTITLPYDK